MTPLEELIAMMAPLLIFVAVLAWVVFVDSTKRWPGVSAFQRYARIITFYRD